MVDQNGNERMLDARLTLLTRKVTPNFTLNVNQKDSAINLSE